MAGPARTITPVPSRITHTRAQNYQQLLRSSRSGEEFRTEGLIAKAFDGKLNVTGTVDLVTGVGLTTDIDDPRISNTTLFFPTALNLNAAAELGAGTMFSAYASPGKITITHAASALTRSFGYVLLG